jgi:hypothetical protein
MVHPFDPAGPPGGAPAAPQEMAVQIPQFPPDVCAEAKRLLGWELSVLAPDPGIVQSPNTPVPACKRYAGGVIQRADSEAVNTWVLVCSLIIQIVQYGQLIMRMQTAIDNANGTDTEQPVVGGARPC